jgi:hypothetical protein
MVFSLFLRKQIIDSMETNVKRFYLDDVAALVATTNVEGRFERFRTCWVSVTRRSKPEATRAGASFALAHRWA